MYGDDAHGDGVTDGDGADDGDTDALCDGVTVTSGDDVGDDVASIVEDGDLAAAFAILPRRDASATLRDRARHMSLWVKRAMSGAQGRARRGRESSRKKKPKNALSRRRVREKRSRAERGGGGGRGATRRR